MCPGLETEQDTGYRPVTETRGQWHGNVQDRWSVSIGVGGFQRRSGQGRLGRVLKGCDGERGHSGEGGSGFYPAPCFYPRGLRGSWGLGRQVHKGLVGEPGLGWLGRERRMGAGVEEALGRGEEGRWGLQAPAAAEDTPRLPWPVALGWSYCQR